MESTKKMEFKFYSVSTVYYFENSMYVDVMKWKNDKWVTFHDECKILSERPLIFNIPSIGSVTPIHIDYFRCANDVEPGNVPKEYIREFRDGQPCILVDSFFLHDIR